MNKNLNREEIRNAIVGMVIGDGCLSRKMGRKGYKVGNAYFQMSHGHKQHDYLLWKKTILENVTNCTVNRNDRKCGFNDKIYEAYHLNSQSNPFYTKLYNRFYYNDSAKSIDEYLVKKIDPLALSIIYMDDGCLGKAMPKYYTKETFYLCLCNFDYANLFLIKKSLKLKYDLDWNINKQSKKPNSDKNYLQLRLLNKHNEKFVEIIKPYVENVECMKYKLGSYANQ